MSERRLEADPVDLYENAPCGMLSTTLDGTIVRVNRTLLDWTGYHADDLVDAKRLVDLLTAGGRIYHETHYAPLLRMQKNAREIAIDIRSADGTRIPCLIDAMVTKSADGSTEIVRLAIFRASDRREYEMELLRARRRAEESEARARVLAETLQASLIPPLPPQIPGLDVGAAYRPAGSGDEVGGDFYDVFEVSPGNWTLVIGDARGKGVQAATVTALARYTLRALAVHELGPERILELLNDAMLRQNPDTFLTVGYVNLRIVGATSDVVGRVVCGGHPLPMVVAEDGSVRTVGRPGTVLGVLTEPSVHEEEFTLGGGDVLTLYTDGITEGRRDDEFFGEERLEEVLAGVRDEAAPAIARRLVDAALEFQDDRPRDDIAVVVVKVPIDAPGVHGSLRPPHR